MFSSLFTQIAVIGGIALAGALFIWRAAARMIQAGKDAERAAALAQQQTKVQDANEARAGVAGATDAQLDNDLRAPGSRH